MSADPEKQNIRQPHVQLCDETVGNEGNYSFKILIDKAAPA